MNLEELSKSVESAARHLGPEKVDELVTDSKAMLKLFEEEEVFPHVMLAILTMIKSGASPIEVLYAAVLAGAVIYQEILERQAAQQIGRNYE